MARGQGHRCVTVSNVLFFPFISQLFSFSFFLSLYLFLSFFPPLTLPSIYLFILRPSIGLSCYLSACPFLYFSFLGFSFAFVGVDQLTKHRFAPNYVLLIPLSFSLVLLLQMTHNFISI